MPAVKTQIKSQISLSSMQMVKEMNVQISQTSLDHLGTVYSVIFLFLSQPSCSLSWETNKHTCFLSVVKLCA
jgi:hypothetical protein